MSVSDQTVLLPVRAFSTYGNAILNMGICVASLAWRQQTFWTFDPFMITTLVEFNLYYWAVWVNLLLSMYLFFSYHTIQRFVSTIISNEFIV